MLIVTPGGRVVAAQEVGVSLAHEEALVRYDPAQLDAAQIIETVADLGLHGTRSRQGPHLRGRGGALSRS